jgi:hypothetical protein
MTTLSGGDAAALRALLSQRPQHDFTPLPQAPHDGDRNALTPDSRRLLAAWRNWRGESLLPQRRDMDLVSVARLMPQMLLLDVHSPTRATFRLAGSDAEQLLGLRLTGRDYLQQLPDEVRACRGAMIWQAVTRPFGLVGFYGIRQPDGGRREAQVCAVPLRPDTEDQPMQLLAVASNLPRLYRDEAMRLTPAGFRLHLLDLGAGLPDIQA